MSFPSRLSQQWKAWNVVRQTTGYRSGLEVKLADVLEETKKFFKHVFYEKVRIPYQVITHAKYLPDWVLMPQCILVEAKGQFTPADRQKMLHVKAEHPNLDIRLVLQNPNTRITSRSRTTYAEWCNKQGFPWCAAKDFPPEAWVKHKPSAASRRAIAPFVEGLV